ncbi:Wzz/FepE/Etk N-terminal domain-containing protein [Pseudidiomarina andamanensis]|uniref:LPS O-antigen length regulator n=1 Tax=Pseudidiomarina andamanensis TaxID=1940690 RepID=A0AA92EUF4_9GAMM|nr:Wzz/FepE/Etk N-terminal domain-containing protein [Pseudidiomarina andamanensis]MDS0217738.1 Wzz/FepE/Etk N-terminal domain-containing protein [Pseudidiomarina andamanensis]QGT96727.1 LPS O-antigen length regulator [Pseudidiomarina andamanensis]
MNINHSQDQYSGFSLLEILLVLRKNWVFLSVSVFVFALGFGIYAFSQPNIYKSGAIVAPAESGDSNSLSNIASPISSVVSLTGLNLGTKKIDEITIAIETLTSRKFLKEFVEKHDILPELMAVESWNPQTEQLVYNREIFDSNKRKWATNEKNSQSLAPSSWSYIPKLRERIEITKNPETGLIDIAVTHISPIVAHQWVTSLIRDINDYMRERDVQEANRSIEYLQNEIAESSLTEMQSVFYNLIEQQTRTRMFANVRPDYVLTIIDPAIVPEGKDSPNRILIIIFGAFLGGFVSVFIIVFKHLLIPSRK